MLEIANITKSQHGGTDSDIFDILAHPRRRFLVHAIKSASGEVEIGELAEQIAAWELEIQPSEVSSQQRKRLYTAIQQQHLPRMADAGFIEYDSNRGTVKPTAAFDDVEVYLETVTGNEFPWSEFYLGLSAVLGALTAVVWLGIWPFRLVPAVGWLTFVVATIAISAVCHRYQNTVMKFGYGDTPPEVVMTDSESRMQ